MTQVLTILVTDYGGLQSDTRLVPVGRLDFVKALTAVIFCEMTWPDIVNLRVFSFSLLIRSW